MSSLRLRDRPGFGTQELDACYVQRAFPLAPILSGWDTSLKPYPRPVCWVLFVGAPAVAWLANSF